MQAWVDMCLSVYFHVCVSVSVCVHVCINGRKGWKYALKTKRLISWHWMELLKTNSTEGFSDFIVIKE